MSKFHSNIYSILFDYERKTWIYTHSYLIRQSFSEYIYIYVQILKYINVESLWSKSAVSYRDCKRNFKWSSMQIFQCLIYNGTLETLIYKKCWRNLRFSDSKFWYLIRTWSEKAFKGTVVNHTLHGGSLEITLD